MRFLEEFLPANFFNKASVVLSGLEPLTEAKVIHRSFEHLLSLTHSPPESISLIEKAYKQEYGTALLTRVREHYTIPKHRRQAIYFLSILLTPKAAELKCLLETNEPLDETELDMFMKHMDKDPNDIFAYEAAYNRYFSKFEYCFEKGFGTLLQRLRVLASNRILPRPYFSKAILFFGRTRFNS